MTVINSSINGDMSNLQDIFRKLVKLWFGQFKSNVHMKDGSNNKTPTANLLTNKSFVKNFYNVGLLAQQAHEFIGVLPDGVAQIQLPEDEQMVTACLEIKI